MSSEKAWEASSTEISTTLSGPSLLLMSLVQAAYTVQYFLVLSGSFGVHQMKEMCKLNSQALHPTSGNSDSKSMTKALQNDGWLEEQHALMHK